MTPFQKTDRDLAIVSVLVAIWAIYCGVFVDAWLFYARRAYRGDE